MNKLLHGVCCLAFLIFSYTINAQSQCIAKLYGASPFQDSLWTIDTSTFQVIDRYAPQLPGKTVTGVLGLARHPQTGVCYAIAKVSGVTGRVLCTMDLNTIVLTEIGNLGDNFSTLAFRPDGQLFGVVGNGGIASETMFLIDHTDATKTLATPLGNGADGEVICYNPDDQFFYHWSGNGTVVFEKIQSTAPYTVTPITSYGIGGEVFGAVYIGNGNFLTSTISSNFRIVNISGTVSNAMGSNPDDLRGLVFGDSGGPSPTTCYRDNDNDGYGNPNNFISICGSCGEGYVTNADDCNDSLTLVNPLATEVCDDIDNDCDEITDETCGCTDSLAYNYDQEALLDDGSCQTCSDGMQNGDESGVDCGGTSCSQSCISPVAVCGDIITVNLNPSHLIYNGTGAADVYLIPSSMLNMGSSGSNPLLIEVKRTSTAVTSSSNGNAFFNWTTSGACQDANPGGGITNEDKGYSWEICLPVSPNDFNKIRTYQLKASNGLGSSTCSGRYKVIYSSGGTNPEFAVENPLDYSYVNNNDQVQIYPNPGSTELNINLDMPAQEINTYTLSIIDVKGKTILSKKDLNENYFKLDVAQLPVGSYSVILQSAEQRIQNRWIKI